MVNASILLLGYTLSDEVGNTVSISYSEIYTECDFHLITLFKNKVYIMKVIMTFQKTVLRNTN